MVERLCLRGGKGGGTLLLVVVVVVVVVVFLLSTYKKQKTDLAKKFKFNLMRMIPLVDRALKGFPHLL